ncbi:MAG: hypothetical protein SGILL_003219 [Bacillariaceae sp.]
MNTDGVAGPPLVVTASVARTDKVRDDKSSLEISPQEEPKTEEEQRDITQTETPGDNKVTFARVEGSINTAVGTRHNLWGEEGIQQTLFEFSESEVSIPDKRRARGPLKKRLSPMPGPGRENENYHHPPPALLWSRTSSSFFPNSAVVRPSFLHNTSTSLLQAHSKLPVFGASRSLGQTLITEPLMKTPQALGEIARRNLMATESVTFTPSNPSAIRKPAPVVTNGYSVAGFSFHGAASKDWNVSASKEPEDHWAGPAPQFHPLTCRDEEFHALTTPKTSNKAASTRHYHDILHPFSATARLLAARGPPTRTPHFSPMVPVDKKPAPSVVAPAKLAPRTAPKTSRLKLAPKPVPNVPRAPAGKTRTRQVFSPKKYTEAEPKPKRKKTIIRLKVKTTKTDKFSKVAKATKKKSKVQVPGAPSKPSFFVNVPTTTRSCKCGGTKCLKLYCECFHGGKFCDPNLCRCTQCMNLKEYNSVTEPKGPRAVAILSIVSRRPLAFALGGRKALTDKEGCHCKNSR